MEMFLNVLYVLEIFVLSSYHSNNYTQYKFKKMFQNQMQT